MARQAKKRGAGAAEAAEAKVFMTGRSQAVRLPNEYRVHGDSVYVKRLAHSKSKIGLSIITLCELQYGIERHAVRQPHLRARHEHLLSEMVAPFDVFQLDDRVVDTYGKVRVAVARSPIGVLDTFVAA